MPTPLRRISPLAWEHPADRAALRALKALPGFDSAIRKVAGLTGERMVRQLFLGDAVLVGPTQRPALHAQFQAVLATLDWPNPGRTAPQLYVTQNPAVRAMAVGFDEPFIVISSGALTLLEGDELSFVLAHEVGHIMSEHMTYRTLATVLVLFGAAVLPFVGAALLVPFQLALLEWHRKSELSADRAALLAVQDSRVAMRTFLKLAGGAAGGDAIDVDAYIAQAAQYESPMSGWDSVLKALNTVLREHPLYTVRAGELQRWAGSGAYETIVSGAYLSRDEPSARPFRDDARDATDYYAAQARAAADSLEDIIRRASDAFRDAFRAAEAGLRGAP